MRRFFVAALGALLLLLMIAGFVKYREAKQLESAKQVIQKEVSVIQQKKKKEQTSQPTKESLTLETAELNSLQEEEESKRKEKAQLEKKRDELKKQLE